MPEDTLFLRSPLFDIEIDDGADRWTADDGAMKALEDRASTPVHEIAWDSGLYDLDDDAKTLTKETELSLRLDEGDNFKLHLG